MIINKYKVPTSNGFLEFKTAEEAEAFCTANGISIGLITFDPEEFEQLILVEGVVTVDREPSIKQASGDYITNLTSDVSASGPGSVIATVNSVGTSSASDIHTAELLANAATSSNTVSTIIKRDGSGNFSAGTITANLTGTASNNALSSVTISTTSPLSGGGDLSANRTLTIAQATTSTSGYLSSTDWNTFNGKLSSGNYLTALTSDVSATGPGSVSATVNSVGGSSAALVHSAELLANAATNVNTNSTIVKRDSSGNFLATLINANLAGQTSGGALTVTGGTAASGGAGGQVTVAGASGSSVGAGGAGGNVTLTGGGANGDNTQNNNGGSVNLTAGTSKGSATGGTITIQCGTGGVGTGTAGATGGTVNVNGGTGGAGSATSGNGGGATLKAGSGAGGVAGGAGGSANLTGGTGGTGSSSGGNGGPAAISGGTAGGNAGANGGAVTIAGAGGSSTGAGGTGGAITLTTGTAGGDNTQSNTGGSLTFTVGSSKGSANGAAITATAGTGGVGTGSLGANGGTYTVTAGNGGVGSATGGVGGNLVFNSGVGGNSGSPGAGGIIQFFTATTTSLTEKLRINATSVLVTNVPVQIQTAGMGLQIKSGSNCKMGTATLVTGAVVVSNTSITSNSLVFLTSQSDGGVVGFVRVTSKVVGTSFTITSSSALDTSTIGWMIVEQM